MKDYDENGPLEEKKNENSLQESQQSGSLKEEKENTNKDKQERSKKPPGEVPIAGGEKPEPENQPQKSVPESQPEDPDPQSQKKEPGPESQPEDPVPESQSEDPTDPDQDKKPEPEQPKPDQPEPDQPKPDQSKPDQPEPDQSEPDPPEPDQSKPDQPKEPPAGEEKDAASTGGTESEQEEKKKSPSIRLIDDEEEQERNLTYDDSLDQEDSEKERDEEEDSDDEEEEERLNYSLLSKEDLVKLLREKLDNPGRGNLRRDIEEIRDAFYEKHEGTIGEKKKNFLEEGGEPEDFKPAEDPVEAEMRELIGKYRSLRADFTRQLEKTKTVNLQKKQEILDQFRELMEGQETFEVTFRRFKNLQKKWFAAGVVPQQNLKDLWDSYNYFVDKFNDYVRINRDLRALDLKKNLELKVQLCERTEALDQEESIVQAFKTLQKYHARWREIGPVPRESRDEVWERFKQATSAINRKHQEHHSRLKKSLQDNLMRKTELCEKVEGITARKYESHAAWVEMTDQVLSIQKTWKAIGYAPKKDNNAIYSRFRRACDTFFQNKAEFYAAAFEEQKKNLRLKTEIAEKAEQLSNSEEWKETTSELIRLQKQWKEIGPVPRKDSDKLWRRFRAACDRFFNRKSKFFEKIDSTFEGNLDAKEKLIAEMEAYKPSGNRRKDLAVLEEFQSQFNDIGFVPSDKKDRIKERFRQEQENLLQRMGMDENERSLFRFRNRVHGLLQSPRSEMKINFERDKLINKLQQLKSDISVWENNIGFFKQSESSEDTIQGFNDKIEDAHQRIRVLEEKIRILEDMENND